MEATPIMAYLAHKPLPAVQVALKSVATSVVTPVFFVRGSDASRKGLSIVETAVAIQARTAPVTGTTVLRKEWWIVETIVARQGRSVQVGTIVWPMVLTTAGADGRVIRERNAGPPLLTSAALNEVTSSV